MISLEFYLELSVLLLMVSYPLLEGLREYYFYQINQAAKFSLRAVDSDRKTVNVFLWVLVTVPFTLILVNDTWLKVALLFTAAAFLRWVALDGVLNLKRGLGFWYAGNSGRSFTDKLLYPLSIPARVVLKLLPLVLLLILIYIL